MSTISNQSNQDLLGLLYSQAGKLADLEREKSELLAATAQLEVELQEHCRNKDEWEWVFEHALDLLVIHDDNGVVTRVSPSVERILGYTPVEFMRLGVGAIVHPDDLAATMEHLGNIASGNDGLNFVTRNRHRDGEWRWISWTTPAPRYNDGVRYRSYAVGRDITLSRLNEQQLLHTAQHDALTGLANRAHFDQAMLQALARAARSRNKVAMLLIDLDGFKAVNDTHGHQAGDTVLKTVAERLRAAQRKGDLVARLGGDEFACLMEDVRTDTPDIVAARVLDGVSQPIAFGNLTVSVGCSIGISAWPDSAATAHELFEHADRAMYKVKFAGKRGFAHYIP